MTVSEQGVQPGRYMLIPRTLIFLFRGGQVLLLRGSPTKRLWANRYNGVGGHVEMGESILNAARRELKEETGLGAVDLWLCGVITVDTGENIGIGIYIFRGEWDDGDVFADRLVSSSTEGVLEWVPVERVDQLPVVEDLKILLPKIQAMQPGDPPFVAHSAYDEHQKMVITMD